MGHYYSEMVSDAELERQAKDREERMQRKADRLKELIKKHGLERGIIEYFEG